MHLIPIDEDWMALFDQIEEPLLIRLAGAVEEGDWELPNVFAGEAARESWWRINSIEPAFADAERHSRVRWHLRAGAAGRG